MHLKPIFPIIIGAVIGSAVVGAAWLVRQQSSAPAVKPEAFTYLKIDCPDKRGVEAVYRSGSLSTDGIWALKIGTESVTFRPPADCWSFLSRLQGAYDKGDKILLVGFETPKATGSRK